MENIITEELVNFIELLEKFSKHETENSKTFEIKVEITSLLDGDYILKILSKLQPAKNTIVLEKDITKDLDTTLLSSRLR